MTGRRFSDLVAIGRVVKPQGRRGEVVVDPLSDRPDRFPSLRRAYVRAAADTVQPIEVTSCWPHKGRFVLKLAGVDSIDEAERLRGMEIGIGEEELASLPAGSYYHHQLKGLPAEDPSGRGLGTVADILETGAGAGVLVMRGPAGELMVPLTDEFVRRVDLARGRIVVVVPELVDADR